MALFYSIQEDLDHTWRLSISDDETLSVLGPYPTAAEAYDHISPAPADDTWECVPVPSVINSAAFNPSFPPSWEQLPLQPQDVTFPEVALTEMQRVFYGDFSGFQLTAKITPMVHWTTVTPGVTTEFGEGVSPLCCTVRTFTYAESGESTASANYTREAKTKCGGTRNCGQPQPIGEDGAVPPPAFFFLIAGSSTAATPNTTHHTDHTTRTTAEGSDAICADDDAPASGDGTAQHAVGVALTGLGFYRGGPADKKVHLYFLATAYFIEGVTLWCYAPVDGVDWKVAYSASAVLPSSGGGVTYTEIDRDGPTILGVATKLWGWSKSIAHDLDDEQLDAGCGTRHATDTGTEEYDPEFDIEEL